MGRALKAKRAKQTPQKKVRVGKKTHKPERLPKRVQTHDVERIAGSEATERWNNRAPLAHNYGNVGIEVNANPRGGRDGAGSRELRRHGGAVQDEGGQPVQPGEPAEELRAIQGNAKGHARRQPKRLTDKEVRLVEALIERHGEDVMAMSRDLEVNTRQHTVAHLRKLLEGYAAHPQLAIKGGNRGFRAPKAKKGTPT